MGHLMNRMIVSNLKVIQYSLFFHISLCSIFSTTLFIYLVVVATHPKIKLAAAKPLPTCILNCHYWGHDSPKADTMGTLILKKEFVLKIITNWLWALIRFKLLFRASLTVWAMLASPCHAAAVNET